MGGIILNKCYQLGYKQWRSITRGTPTVRGNIVMEVWSRQINSNVCKHFKFRRFYF